MSRFKSYFPLLILAAVLALVLASGLTRYLGLSTLKENGADLHAFIAGNAVLALVIYVGIYALATTAISIPGAAILTLAGGYLFRDLGGRRCHRDRRHHRRGDHLLRGPHVARRLAAGPGRGIRRPPQGGDRRSPRGRLRLS